MTVDSSGPSAAPSLWPRDAPSRRLAVAMSGGLDSSVAAALAAERGYDVFGLSMLLWESSGAPARNGRCCASLDLGDARRVASQIPIPHYTLRLDREFRQQVVDPFVRDYLDGRTPSPCIGCNTWIKFDALLEQAFDLGAELLVTGHYARIEHGPGGAELHRGADHAKDQSYFLFELSQQQLDRAWFPLGAMTKSQVREQAARLGLLVADKGESMEVCFVDRGVREFIESELDRLPPERLGAVERGPAEVVDEGGRRLGTAQPYYRYTVGQRRGLRVATGERLYVLGIDARRNRVTVGREERLVRQRLEGERLHWIGPPPPASDGWIDGEVQIRSAHRPIPGRIRAVGAGGALVELDRPAKGVAPGQAAVFYRGTRVLGGCWIASPR